MTKRQTPQKQTKIDYPTGSFIRTEKSLFFVSGPKKLFRIITPRVLDSWSPHRIIETSERSLNQYKIVAKLKFRNGSLLHSFQTGKIYLVVDGQRRHITDPDVLFNIGARYEDAVSVSTDELNLQPEGEKL